MERKNNRRREEKREMERRKEKTIEDCMEKWSRVFSMEPSKGYNGEEIEIETEKGVVINKK